MEKKRVFIAGFVIALLSFTVVVAGCTSSTSSNNTSSAPVQTSENTSMTKTGNVNASSAPVQRSENTSMTNTGNVTNATPGEPITVAQGRNFTITLRSNPSTGYNWEPQFDRTALSLINSVFISDPNPHNLVGVPGSQVFTFQGLVKGTTTITFDNVSPSQIVTEQATYAVTVT